MKDVSEEQFKISNWNEKPVDDGGRFVELNLTPLRLR